MIFKNITKLKKRLSMVVMGAMTVGLISSIIPVRPVEAATTSEKRSVMYYGDWSIWGAQQNFYPKDIPADQLTHLNFAFIYFDANGNLVFTDKDAAVGAPVGMPGVQWEACNAGILNAFQDLKAENPNLKIGVSVGGWSKSHTFADVSADPVKRANLVENLMKFIEYTNMDFIDIDWEYPSFVRDPDKIDNQNDEGTKNSKPEDKENFVILLQDLKDALDKQGKELGKDYELSTAIPAPKSKIDLGIDVKGVFDVVDFANIMTYDMRGAWDETSGHQTGLYANPNDPTKGQGLSVDESVKYYMEKGAPAEKIVVGAAFYTRGWEKVSKGPDPSTPGLYGKAEVCTQDADQTPSRGAKNEAPLKAGDGGRMSGVWSYRSIDKLKTLYPGLKEYWDDTAKAPYLYDEETGAFFTYDNVRSIEEKCKYVNDNNLGGMIAWMAGQDKPTTSSKRDELTKAMKEGLFGSAELPDHKVEFGKIDVDCKVEPYAETGIAGGGYKITIKNNETLTEKGEVLSSLERSYESIKTPKFYIKTNEDLVAGDYTAGKVTREGEYLVVDLSAMYDGQFIEPGKTYIFTLKGSEAPKDNSKIREVLLSQKIYNGGTELSRQSIFKNTSEPTDEAPEILGATNKSILVGEKFDPMEGVTARDVEDGDLTNSIKVTGIVDVNKKGSYKLVYTVEDSKGKVTTVERTITVTEEVVGEFEPWSRDIAQTKSYPVGSKVTHKGKIWEQIGPTASWYGEPGVAKEWKDIGEDPNYVEKIEPWSEAKQNAQGYEVGVKVTHKGKTYIQSGTGTCWYGEPGTSSGSKYWKVVS